MTDDEPKHTMVIVDENEHHADQLYAWLSDDGKGEGPVAVYQQLGWTPMVFCLERVALMAEPAVLDLMRTLRAHNQKITCRLVKFSRGETIKEL